MAATQSWNTWRAGPAVIYPVTTASAPSSYNSTRRHNNLSDGGAQLPWLDFFQLQNIWRSDVIELSIKLRRHVGSIFDINRVWMNMLKFENLRQGYSQTVSFEWCAIPHAHTTVCKRTYVFDITLLQYNIPSTWRRNYILYTEWRHFYTKYTEGRGPWTLWTQVSLSVQLGYVVYVKLKALNTTTSLCNRLLRQLWYHCQRMFNWPFQGFRQNESLCIILKTDG